MFQSKRCLNLLGVAGLMFACAVGSSRLTLADGTAAPEVKSIPSGKPNPATRSERNAASAKAHATTKITAEREAVAIAFAGQNHPELSLLLANLKQNNPTEYHAAVVELDRIVERLASLKSKNVSQHDSELAHWKMDSRIRLMAARLTMSDNPALEAELKVAVREKVELTLAERKAERDRLQKRVEKLDQTIGDLATKLDEVAEKEFAALKRSAQSSKPTAKTKPVKKGEAHAAAKSVDRTANSKDKGAAKPSVKASMDK
ncbi:MAG: hypothetical protein NTZ32_05180 [Planctomycetales bacterium]|nr:hypothetical protein [Planctomycetales bacterium]